MADNWPPKAGLSSKVVPRASAILVVSAHTHIDAPAALVFSVIRDTSRYKEWNSFCPQVHIHSQTPQSQAADQTCTLHLGTSFTYDVIMNEQKPQNVTPTQLRVTDISTPDSPSSYISTDILENDGSWESDLSRVYRISWTTEGSFVARGLRSERTSEVIDLGEGKGCEYRTWECQGGVLARAVKWTYGSVLPRKFELWCADLKKEAERQVRSG